MVIKIYATARGAAWSTRSLIWSSDGDSLESGVYNGKLSTELNKAGELSFTISTSHPYYIRFQKMGTVLTVVTDDGDTLFRGRVTELESDLYKQLTITAADALIYLEDSIYIPSNEDKTSTPREMFKAAIANHNTQMVSEPDKIFNVTESTIDISTGIDTAKVFNDNTYQDTFAYLDSEFIDQFGGYFRIRYNSDYTVQYLDWVDSYKTNSTQDVKFGENIVELTRNDITEDIFTVLVPAGNEKVHLENQNGNRQVTVTDQTGVKQTIDVTIDGRYIRIPSGISKYGLIYKAESFSVDNSDSLLTEALDYISNNYRPELLSFKVQIIDMHWLNDSTRRIHLGDLCNVYHEYGQTTPEKITCTAIEYDLMEPEQTEFTIGVPNQTLSKKQNKSSSNATKSASSNSSQIGSCAVKVNGKVSTLQNDIVEIIGKEYVIIEGGSIQLNTDSFTLADTLGKAMITTDDTAEMAKDIAVRISNIITGNLWVDNSYHLFAHIYDEYVENIYVEDNAFVGEVLQIGNKIAWGGTIDKNDHLSGDPASQSWENGGLVIYTNTGTRKFVVPTEGCGATIGVHGDFPFELVNIDSAANLVSITPRDASYNVPITANQKSISVSGSSGVGEFTAGGAVRVKDSSDQNLFYATPVSNTIYVYDKNSPGNRQYGNLFEHRHVFGAEEEKDASGKSTGKINITLGRARFDTPYTDQVASFDIASTSYHIAAIADAKAAGQAAGVASAGLSVSDNLVNVGVNSIKSLSMWAELASGPTYDSNDHKYKYKIRAVTNVGTAQNPVKHVFWTSDELATDTTAYDTGKTEGSGSSSIARNDIQLSNAGSVNAQALTSEYTGCFGINDGGGNPTGTRITINNQHYRFCITVKGTPKWYVFYVKV